MTLDGVLERVRSFVRRRSASEGGSLTDRVLVTQVVGYAFG
jgi:hypothetical protein